MKKFQEQQADGKTQLKKALDKDRERPGGSDVVPESD